MEEQTRKAGRPKKEVHQKRINITIHPDIHNQLKNYCSQNNQTVSCIIESYIKGLVNKNN